MGALTNITSSEDADWDNPANEVGGELIEPEQEADECGECNAPIEDCECDDDELRTPQDDLCYECDEPTEDCTCEPDECEDCGQEPECCTCDDQCDCPPEGHSGCGHDDKPSWDDIGGIGEEDGSIAGFVPRSAEEPTEEEEQTQDPADAVDTKGGF